MASNPANLKKIQELLQAGALTDAMSLLASEISAAPAPAPAAAAAAPSPAAPRLVDEIIFDLLGALVNHLGAPPALQTLLNELTATAKA